MRELDHTSPGGHVRWAGEGTLEMGSKASAAGLACASEELRTELIVAEAAGSKAELY